MHSYIFVHGANLPYSTKIVWTNMELIFKIIIQEISVHILFLANGKIYFFVIFGSTICLDDMYGAQKS